MARPKKRPNLRSSGRRAQRADHHTHPPRVGYVLSDAKIRVTEADGSHQDYDEKTGETYWADFSSLHDTLNVDTKPYIALLVEVKAAAGQGASEIGLQKSLSYSTEFESSSPRLERGTALSDRPDTPRASGPRSLALKSHENGRSSRDFRERKRGFSRAPAGPAPRPAPEGIASDRPWQTAPGRR